MWFLFLILLAPRSIFAPFPKGHQLNWANPFIDPVWEQLEPETRKDVYDEWLKKEPSKKALLDFVEYSDRKKIADAEAWKNAKSLFKLGLKELKDAWKGQFPSPSYTSDVKIEGTKENPGKVKTQTRYRISSQLQWENFMAAFQYALHVRLAEKRALYQYFLENARKHGAAKKQSEKKLKDSVKAVKDKVKGSYLKFLEKYQEKLYKVWVKADETKKSFK